MALPECLIRTWCHLSICGFLANKLDEAWPHLPLTSFSFLGLEEWLRGRGLRPAHASRDLWPSVRSASASLVLNLNLNLTLMVTYLCDWRAAVALWRGVGSSTNSQVLFAAFLRVFRQPKTVAKCYSAERKKFQSISIISIYLWQHVVTFVSKHWSIKWIIE